MKERPLAATMGEDPRPYLTAEEVDSQLRISKMTLDEWNEAWERKLARKPAPPF